MGFPSFFSLKNNNKQKQTKLPFLSSKFWLKADSLQAITPLLAPNDVTQLPPARSSAFVDIWRHNTCSSRLITGEKIDARHSLRHSHEWENRVLSKNAGNPIVRPSCDHRATVGATKWKMGGKYNFHQPKKKPWCSEFRRVWSRSRVGTASKSRSKA